VRAVWDGLQGHGAATQGVLPRLLVAAV